MRPITPILLLLAGVACAQPVAVANPAPQREAATPPIAARLLPVTNPSFIAFSLEQPAYVAIFEIVPNGNVSLVYPWNERQLAPLPAGLHRPYTGMMRARWAQSFPRLHLGAPYDRPVGPNTYFMIASAQPLAIQQFVRSPDRIRRDMGGSFFAARSESVVIHQLIDLALPIHVAGEAWVSDVAHDWSPVHDYLFAQRPTSLAPFMLFAVDPGFGTHLQSCDALWRRMPGLRNPCVPGGIPEPRPTDEPAGADSTGGGSDAVAERRRSATARDASTSPAPGALAQPAQPRHGDDMYDAPAPRAPADRQAEAAERHRRTIEARERAARTSGNAPTTRSPPHTAPPVREPRGNEAESRGTPDSRPTRPAPAADRRPPPEPRATPVPAGTEGRQQEPRPVPPVAPPPRTTTERDPGSAS